MKYLVLLLSLALVSCNNSKNMSNSSKDINLVGNYEVFFISEIENEDVFAKKITINFNVDGKVNGNNSCNNYGGEYKIDDNKLSFGMMMSTRKFCKQNAKIETTFMRNLTEVDSFEIKEDVLILLRGNIRVIEAKKASTKEN